MRYCPKCNQTYGDKIKECPICGRKLVKVAY